MYLHLQHDKLTPIRQYTHNVQTCRSITEGPYGPQGGDDENNGAHHDEGHGQAGDHVPQVETPVGQLLHQGQHIVTDQIYVHQDQDTGNDEGQPEYLQDRARGGYTSEARDSPNIYRTDQDLILYLSETEARSL